MKPLHMMPEQSTDLVAIARDIEARMVAALAVAAGVPINELQDGLLREFRGEAVTLVSAINLSGLTLIPRKSMRELVDRYVAAELERVRSEGVT